MKAAILGSTGYTGLVLLRYLLDHPHIDEVLPVSSSSVGDSITEYDPGISAYTLKKKIPAGKLISVDEAKKAKPEVVFAALPHLKSAEIASDFFEDSVIIDLSADFRIEDGELFEKAYGESHPNPELQKHAVYGLAEWYKDKVKTAKLIANPGCYPTATLLPLLPLKKEGLIGDDIIVNALSGISGAGRSAKPNSMFFKRAENANVYNPGTKHRHQIEIKKELDFQPGDSSSVIFNPHLIPLRRGMVVTTVVNLEKGLTNEEIEAAYNKYYSDAPFINILPNMMPDCSNVVSSNRCDISWQLEDKKLLLFSTIDNLVKGASGQAVQNMNIRFGYPETTGLSVNGEL